MKKILAFAVALFIGFSINAQDSNFVRKVIRDLSSPAFYGRGCSFGGDSIAADYIIKTLKEIGFKAFPSGYSQNYQFNAFAMEKPAIIKIGDTQLELTKDFQIATFSKSVQCNNAKILQVNPDVLRSKTSIEQFLLLNKGKLKDVFVYFSLGKESKISKTVEKSLNQLRKENVLGCKGYFFGYDSKFPTMSVGSCDFERDYSLIYIKDSIMQDFLGKDKTFKGKKKKMSISFQNNFIQHNARNVAAFIEGTEQADSFYVFTAHYDHLGSIGGVLYPGAHDNASGTATVLDLARYFKSHPSKYSVAVILFSGEEEGLYGSLNFEKNPMFDLSKIKLLVNIDMFCGGDEGLMVFNAESDNTKSIFERIKSINDKEHYVLEVKPNRNSPNSDHYPFTKHCPAIFLLTMGGEFGGYHDPFDTCERCQLKHYNNVITLLLKTLNEL